MLYIICDLASLQQIPHLWIITLPYLAEEGKALGRVLLFDGNLLPKGLETLVPRAGRGFGVGKAGESQGVGIGFPLEQALRTKGRLGVVFWYPWEHFSTPAAEFEGSREDKAGR